MYIARGYLRQTMNEEELTKRVVNVSPFNPYGPAGAQALNLDPGIFAIRRRYRPGFYADITK